jgi:hypothetical protein
VTRGADALHPLAQLLAGAVELPVRWSLALDDDGSVLAITDGMPTDDRDLLVLAATDPDGDSTAVSLDPRHVASLRDALTDWLEERA